MNKGTPQWAFNGKGLPKIDSHNKWTVNSLNVNYIEKPFYIEDLPLAENVYVIDDYLAPNLHRALDYHLQQCSWQKTNEVKQDGGWWSSRGGLPNHSLWGAAFMGPNGTDGYLNGPSGYPNYIIKWLNRKLQTDFGFKWVRFQYAGANSQLHGQQGTCHSDCQDYDEWNLSFLYYTNQFWNPNWGGRLRFYDTNVKGGTLKDMDEYEIGAVDFVPNRLLMFDGRIQHGAEAPSEDAKYIDRKSIVIRGDECILLNKEDRYANH